MVGRLPSLSAKPAYGFSTFEGAFVPLSPVCQTILSRPRSSLARLRSAARSPSSSCRATMRPHYVKRVSDTGRGSQMRERRVLAVHGVGRPEGACWRLCVTQPGKPLPGFQDDSPLLVEDPAEWRQLSRGLDVRAAGDADYTDAYVVPPGTLSSCWAIIATIPKTAAISMRVGWIPGENFIRACRAEILERSRPTWLVVRRSPAVSVDLPTAGRSISSEDDRAVLGGGAAVPPLWPSSCIQEGLPEVPGLPCDAALSMRCDLPCDPGLP